MGALIGDIWRSLRSLPLWVQIWVFVILVPANMLSVLFLDQPFGNAVAFMAIGGIAPNAVLMIVQRGFSKAMAISHLIFWIPLILLLLGMITGELPWSQSYVIYFWCLLVINSTSLVFDVLDFGKWFQGDRSVAGSSDYGTSGFY